MADRIDHLFQEWHQLGGAVLLAMVDPAIVARPPEQVIAESTAHCRASGRLTWVVLDWLIQHVESLDADRLLNETRRGGDLSVLGLLCDAAHQRKCHPTFERIMHSCPPAAQVEPFFHRVARSELASRLAHERPLEVFTRWNYVSNELRYLSDR